MQVERKKLFRKLVIEKANSQTVRLSLFASTEAVVRR